MRSSLSDKTSNFWDESKCETTREVDKIFYKYFLERYRTHICTGGSVETDTSVADLSVSLCVVVVAPVVCGDTTE